MRQEIRGRLRTGYSSSFRILQPVAFAGGFDNRATVGEFVEGGSGEPFVAEDLGPMLETEVGGEHDARAFVVEEQEKLR